jgi:hypothetical protein
MFSEVKEPGAKKKAGTRYEPRPEEANLRSLSLEACVSKVVAASQVRSWGSACPRAALEDWSRFLEPLS